MPPALILNIDCSHTGILLDGNIFVNGHFEDMDLYFDGGQFWLDRANVSIRNCRLIIGPHATDQSVEGAKQMIGGAITTASWKSLRLDEAWQKILIWNRGTQHLKYMPLQEK